MKEMIEVIIQPRGYGKKFTIIKNNLIKTLTKLSLLDIDKIHLDLTQEEIKVLLYELKKGN